MVLEVRNLPINAEDARDMVSIPESNLEEEMAATPIFLPGGIIR